jgi:dethiobiotin synthetase
MKQAYFVIGTDTSVGKTYVASALIKHFANQDKKTVGMKPIASGCELSKYGIWTGQLVNDDVVALYEAGNVPAPLELINPYHFESAIAPHIAAQKVGIDIDLDVIARSYHALAELVDVVVVEGAGGFLVPINAQQTLADLVVKLDLPIILVVGMRLGCINHALLTVEAIKARGLKLAGWVANQIEPNMSMFEENLASLQQRIDAPCLSVVGWQDKVEFHLVSSADSTTTL